MIRIYNIIDGCCLRGQKYFKEEIDKAKFRIDNSKVKRQAYTFTLKVISIELFIT